MALFLHEIQWEEPFLPESDATEWNALAKKHLRFVCNGLGVVARSRWLAHLYLVTCTNKPKVLGRRLTDIVTFVAAQENACRYCYGTTRMQLLLAGYDERFIERLEREVSLGGLDPLEQRVADFSRALSRSSPRPSAHEARALFDLGLSIEQLRELLVYTGLNSLFNRLTTLTAVPLETSLEAAGKHPLVRLFRPFLWWVMSNIQSAVPPHATETPYEGPYHQLVEHLGDSDVAQVISEALRGVFEESQLSHRTSLLMFATVARALSCDICEDVAFAHLEADGLPARSIDDVLTHLAADQLSQIEVALIPWTRETVRYEPHIMQQSTRRLSARIGPELTLEAIGVASVANTIVRVALLATLE